MANESFSFSNSVTGGNAQINQGQNVTATQTNNSGNSFDIKELLAAIVKQAPEIAPQMAPAIEVDFSEGGELYNALTATEASGDATVFDKARQYAPVVTAALKQYAPQALRAAAAVYPPLNLLAEAIGFVFPTE